MTILGSSIDPLEGDLLIVPALGWSDESLPQGDWALAASSDAALEHDKVILNFTIAWETTHWSDGLFSLVVFSRCVVLDLLVSFFVVTLANTVNLLILFGTVEVTALTNTGNRPLNTGRMPSTDTSDLAETLVGLARQLLDAPTGSYTLIGNMILVSGQNNAFGSIWKCIISRKAT